MEYLTKPLIDKMFVGYTTDLSLDWVMGFIEGEGCFTHSRKNTYYQSFSLIISQKERESLDRINEFFGGWGHVKLLPNKTGGCHNLIFNRHTLLRDLALIIAPKFRTKKKKKQFDEWYNLLISIPIGCNTKEKRWTEKEIAIVKNNLNMDTHFLQELLVKEGCPKRTYFAVEYRQTQMLKKLGLSRPHKHEKSLCPKCGEYGILRLDLQGKPVVRHYEPKPTGGIQHTRSHWVTSLALIEQSPQYYISNLLRTRVS